ncbi:hypothetical protein PVAND_010569 [Polypedilum vanderplanki]|uniref:Uncharacterized protein n=1 Tax=Polypedilum vanderplanki TaxID=319348 RepID=A0A9J6CG06_POLVA|nr:hypothetical protein PVAND_010569 [Polypedilum vanderplanki]
MSSKRGDTKRSRPQRHQNTFAFKNNLHDNSTKIKKLNAMSINEVCTHCSEVIQWKIQYRKYKPLTKPKTCNRCNERNVKKAYHVLCRDCALATKQCAKCLKKEGENCEIIPAEPTEEERVKLDIEMRQMIKSLPERKRRTFLRFMNGKKKKNKNADEDVNQEEVEEKPRKMPTRDELLDKLEQLKVSEEKEDEFYDDINESDDEDDWISDDGE